MKKFLLMFLFSGLLVVSVGFYALSLHKNISEPLLRLHIVANSDDAFDQELKIKVRDSIIEKIGDEFKNSDNKDLLRKKMTDSFKKIEDITNEVLSENGAMYKSSVIIGKSYIPRKNYNGIILPEGKYESIIIKLGEASGENWWCVVYPPLCFTEDTCGELSPEGKEYLKSCLSDESYSLITDKNIDIEYKFKIIEVFQRLRNKLSK